jgi:hypothetical protein
MHWLLLVISVVFALAAAATVAVPEGASESATPPAAPEAKPPAPEAAKPKSPPSAESPPKAQISPAEVRKIADEYYKQCMNDWDAATHMTKQEWHHTCRRLADNRANFRVEMGTGKEIQSPSQ